jgi:hypothetical protein
LVAPAENSTLGNKRFAEKALAYADVDYKLTKELATLGNLVAGEKLWGAEDIEARGRSLAETCCRLWPRPEPAVSLAIPESTQINDLDEFDIGDEEAVPFTSSIAEEDE